MLQKPCVLTDETAENIPTAAKGYIWLQTVTNDYPMLPMVGVKFTIGKTLNAPINCLTFHFTGKLFDLCWLLHLKVYMLHKTVLVLYIENIKREFLLLRSCRQDWKKKKIKREEDHRLGCRAPNRKIAILHNIIILNGT